MFKKHLLTSHLLFLAAVLASPVHAADPEVGAAIVRQFGEAQLQNVVLVKASPNEADPIQWKVYSRDPYREGELLRTIATKLNGQWDAKPAGAGKLLERVPKQRVDFTRLKVSAREARGIASQAAALAQMNFVKVDYQLATNEQTTAPEWGLALLDAAGVEIGFCVISAETGAVLSQDWTQEKAAAAAKPNPRTQAEKEGAAAARKVKQGVRKAWSWGEHETKKAGSFFRELFKP